jgi:hypothetical protein
VVDADGGIVEGGRYRRDEHGIMAPCRRLIELGVLLVALAAGAKARADGDSQVTGS